MSDTKMRIIFGGLWLLAGLAFIAPINWLLWVADIIERIFRVGK